MSSTPALTLADRRPQLVARLADYGELTRPKIAVLELVTVAAAAALAGLQTWPLIHALTGTLLVAASASAANQLLERRTDARMRRTSGRPLPQGRLLPGEVFWFSLVLGIVGVVYLLLTIHWFVAGIALATWALYVLVYTPMKRRSPANTAVGAVAGAMPVLIGWSAMGQPISLEALTLFLIVFLWQFPHFMAIAWMYRSEYAAAGLKMLPVVEPSGVRAGAQAVVAALLLLPVTMLPALFPTTGSIYPYVASSLLLAASQLACAVAFLLKLDENSARRLLRASLIYLPGVLASLLLATPLP